MNDGHRERTNVTKLLRSIALRVVLACQLLGSIVFGEEEEVLVLEAAVVAQVEMFQMTESTFDSWVFQNTGGSTATEARKQIDQGLRARFNLIERAATLTPEQREKLELAGRGDVQRFFDDLQAAKRKVPMGMMPITRINEVWQMAQPLTQRLTRGLHGPGSLFQKTIRTTLDTEQLHALTTLEEERNQRQYAAVVRSTIALIESTIPLTRVQRERFTTVVLTKTKPPVTYGQSYYQSFLVLYQMSKLPEEDLRPIFNEPEWKIVSEMLRTAKQYEQMFKQQGIQLDDANGNED